MCMMRLEGNATRTRGTAGEVKAHDDMILMPLLLAAGCWLLAAAVHCRSFCCKLFVSFDSTVTVGTGGAPCGGVMGDRRLRAWVCGTGFV